MYISKTGFTEVFTQSLRSAVLAILVLLALIWLLQSLRFLDFLVNKGLGLGIFLQLTGLLIPRLLVVIVPIGVLAGAIMVARRMQDDHETTAWQAAGASPWGMIQPFLVLGVLGSLLLYCLMLVVLPASITAFKDLQTDLRTRQGQLLLEEGTFNPLGDDLTVYVQRRIGAQKFEQLLVHDTRTPNAPVTWYAKAGEVVVQPNGAPQLALQQGLRQEIGPKGVNVLEFENYTLDISAQLNAPPASARAPEVEERSLRETWQLAYSPTLNAQQAAELKAEAMHRLTWPLLAIPLALIAAAALLHAPRRKQSSIHGVVVAALSGVVLLAGQFGWLSVVQGGGLWAMVLMVLWPVAFLGIAYGVWRYGRA